MLSVKFISSAKPKNSRLTFSWSLPADENIILLVIILQIAKQGLEILQQTASVHLPLSRQNFQGIGPRLRRAHL